MIEKAVDGEVQYICVGMKHRLSDTLAYGIVWTMQEWHPTLNTVYKYVTYMYFNKWKLASSK